MGHHVKSDPLLNVVQVSGCSILLFGLGYGLSIKMLSVQIRKVASNH